MHHQFFPFTMDMSGLYCIPHIRATNAFFRGTLRVTGAPFNSASSPMKLKEELQGSPALFVGVVSDELLRYSIYHDNTWNIYIAGIQSVRRIRVVSIPYAPWCWNIYQHLPYKSPSFVGKYASTMEHMGLILLYLWKITIFKFGKPSISIRAIEKPWLAL